MEDRQLIDESIRRYYEVNDRSKKDGKTLKELGGTLKSLFKIGDTHKTEDGYELAITKQERTSMDNEVLVQILKERGFDGAIKTVEVPDDKAVEELLFSGELTAVDIQPAVKTNIISVLKIKWSGGKKDAKAKKTVSKKETTKETF